jgi:hypothetical protein
VVATEINVAELPEALKMQLSDYKEYSIMQVYELDQSKSKEYCVVLQSASKHIVLKGKNKWRVGID